jgi:uncharacterized protein (TIGR02145 family)
MNKGAVMNKYLLIVVAAAVFGAFAQTTGTFKDSRDGKTYKTVKIGTSVWMAENLNFAAEGSVCYGNNDANCDKYGRLYDWDTALKACPAGYHLPLDDEWAALVNYAGGKEKAGKMLKSSKGWESKKGVPVGTNDEYSFSALPGGLGNSGGSFYNAGYYGYWWSATEDSADYARRRGVDYNLDYVSRNDVSKTLLFSVRCVKD